MRLINIYSLELEEYFDEDIPEYAILSHTWTDQEVSYQDWQAIRRFEALPKEQKENPQDSYARFQRDQARSLQQKTGYDKIIRCCQQAEKDKLEYAWVDTCCINKTSSAELSEAINSMYRWYNDAKLCYAYLSDVQGEENNTRDDIDFDRMRNQTNADKNNDPEDDQHRMYIQDEDSAFRRSLWFTRGWTLQELLAPPDVFFLDATWHCIAAKYSTRKPMFDTRDSPIDISELLSDITGIKMEYLCKKKPLEEACISERMSWASKRTTTRREDMAYCLLGIFGVNMPLLYGEGDRAFVRLQEEIMKESTDQTIFVWGYRMELRAQQNELLASSPKYFLYGSEVQPSTRNGPSPSFQMTNKGLQIRLRLYTYPEVCGDCIYAALNCINTDGESLWFPILPHHDSQVEDDHEFCKIPQSPVGIRVPRDAVTEDKTIFIVKKCGLYKNHCTTITSYSVKSDSYFLVEIFPPTLFFNVRDGSKMKPPANIFLRFDGPDPFVMVIDFESFNAGSQLHVGLWDISRHSRGIEIPFSVNSVAEMAFHPKLWPFLKDKTWPLSWQRPERITIRNCIILYTHIMIHTLKKTEGKGKAMVDVLIPRNYL